MADKIESEVVDTEAEETEAEEAEETETESTEASKGDKPKETPQQKKARLERQLKRVKRELGETDEEPAPSEKKPKSGKFEYGELAYLKSYGIEGSDELQLVRQYVGHGKALEDIVKNKVFLGDLTELREARDAKNALPSGSKRSTGSGTGDVDYWLKKGELPPNTPENQQLRRDVVNAREKQAKGSQRFSDNPVVG